MQVLESAKAHLAGGRADQVIAELGPMLLNEASVLGPGAFTTKQSILEGLQLLQASPLLRGHLSRHKGSCFSRGVQPKLTLADSGNCARTHDLSWADCMLTRRLSALTQQMTF